MKRYLSLPALSLAALLALAACGTDAEPVTPVGDAGENHNDADVMFAQMMIPHHEQAVEMSDIMLGKEDISSEVAELAARIKQAQAPEIETMTGWLQTWGEPISPDGGMEGHDMGGGMDGMMSEEQMAELEAVGGEGAARTFLESMTEHHNGAVEMAQAEIDNGEDPEAIALAETIVQTQEAEIQDMEELLAEL